jgi:hypothetical protein
MNARADSLTGSCLCGAVRIVATPRAAEASACHCGLCRRWTGAALWVVEVPAAEVAVAGEVRTYRSSAFAERAFCPTCGTHLWIRDDGGDYELMPGLFAGAAGFPLVREVYADRAFAGVTLAGSHERVRRAAYEAANAHVAGESA